MTGFMESIRQRRQYLLHQFGGTNNITSNTTAPINTAARSQYAVVNNANSLLSLKLTLLCFLTTLGGYLSDPVIIERLLYPARFYNTDGNDAIVIVQLMLTTSLGCSTLQILLHCFHVHRSQGLFDPKNIPTLNSNVTFGNTLGTSFYPAHRAWYCKDGGFASVRNGFWARVLELVPHSKVHYKFDYEMLESNRLKIRGISNFDKTKITPGEPINRLVSKVQKSQDPRAYVVSEKRKTYKKYFGNIFISEFPAFALMSYYAFSVERQPGFFAFILALLYSFMVKIFFACCTVERKTFHVLNAESAHNTDSFEVQYGGSRLSFIEGEHSLIRRFSEYYGQPVRNVLLERVLMAALAISLGPLSFVVAFFVLNTEHYAYPWLAHQAFVMSGWFLARLFNLNNCGRTEERIAKALYKGNNVIFVNEDGTSAIEMTLHTTFVAPKPATAPTLVSAKPLYPIAEEKEDDAATWSTLSDSSSVEIVTVVQKDPPGSVASGSQNGDKVPTSEPQTPGFQAPTTPAILVRLPNATSKLKLT